MNSRKTIFACALSLLVFFSANISARAADDPLAWPPITSQTRPWVWWWWHGSAVDETNITHELQRFHDAGLGGVQITSIFGVNGAESRDIPYLSPMWLAMMGYSVDEAKKLGMGVTMTLGTGWCFGGPTVSDEDANAYVVVTNFDIGAGKRLQQKFDRKTTQALVAFSPDGKSVELTDKISADGEVNWTAPSGSWKVYAISQQPSPQKVKRPAPGGEGWMLNPAYPQAMTNWLTWFDKPFADYHGSKPQAVFQDSYEYRTDWSPDFFARFEKLRGYKLQTELPALFADEQTNNSTIQQFNDTDRVARVKYDYRRTLSDIMVEQSEPTWIDWAHKNGFSTIYQAHGTPGNWLDLYAEADMPETEMFHNDRSILISKFASSAAHTQGRALVGAETGTWVKEHFTETLADVKSVADDMFLSGINHIFYHGACYSPDDAPWPGWVFYASTEMNSRNSIWHDVPALNEYVARVQSVLQSGKPDNDILLYWPVADFWSDPSGRVQPMSVSLTNWFEGQNIAKTAHELWDLGYAFDYVSDAQLLKAKVADGKIQMPGGDYKVIVVPECKFMPLETFKQLLALAENGATVIFEKQLPLDVSGLNGLEKQRKEFQELTSKLSFHPLELHDGKCEEARLGKGNLLIRDAISAYSLGNAIAENMSRDGLSFVRRSIEGGWTYFIANRNANSSFAGYVELARPAKSAIILDPMSGKVGMAEPNNMAVSPSGSITSFLLQLGPGESLILHAFKDRQVAGRAWDYMPISSILNGLTNRISLKGIWDVKFLEGGPTLPADFQTTKLGSWTTFPDTNTQAFAGTAKYETTFDAPNLQSAIRNPQFFLNLGDVRQSARVKLNGKDYGTFITPPFRVVVDNLKPTGNQLEVEVTSVAANRIRDLDRRGVKWKIFKDINIVNVDYKPFDASNWPLTDCGLLGPVTLTPVTAVAN